MGSTILGKLHEVAIALSRSVERVNARIRTRRGDGDTQRLLVRTRELNATFARLAESIPTTHADYEAVAHAREIYDLIVQRLESEYLNVEWLSLHPPGPGHTGTLRPALERAAGRTRREPPTSRRGAAEGKAALRIGRARARPDSRGSPAHRAHSTELTAEAPVGDVRMADPRGAADRASSDPPRTTRLDDARFRWHRAGARHRVRLHEDDAEARCPLRSPAAFTDATRAAAHSDLLARAADAVHESRVRVRLLHDAAREAHVMAERAAALVDASTRTLRAVSEALYGTGRSPVVGEVSLTR
jgi:hypothetical protein